MINSGFKKDIEAILALINEHPHYKGCYKGAKGGIIKTMTFDSRTVVPFKLLKDLDSLHNLIGKQELLKLITEQMCMETLVDILRNRSNGDSSIRNIETKHIAHVASELGHDSLIVSPEFACLIQEDPSFEFSVGQDIFSGLYLFGVLKGKNVYVNASQSSKIFYALNFGNMEFEVSVDEVKSEFGEAHFKIFAQYNDNILVCGLKDFVNLEAIGTKLDI